MIGIGTLINVVCIVGGGIIGSLFGHVIKSKMQQTILQITGVAVLFLGMEGAIKQANNTSSLVMIISLVLGAFIGEMFQIDQHIQQFGQWLKIKTNNAKDPKFVNGFVTTSCTVCIGAMAILGSIQDGIFGDPSILIAKGILDAIIVCILTISLGKGCIFSAIPVGLLQGSVTVLAHFAGNFMSTPALNAISYVGSILIFCVGLNLIRKEQIRVANILPSLIFAAVFALIQ